VKRYRNPRGEMPFLDHLEELRWRIFKAVGALFVATAIGFFLVYRYQVIDLLIEPANPYLPEEGLAYFSPTTPFFFILKLSVLAGVILSFPIILYQVWAFLSPALEKREKRLIVPALYGGMLLFAAGAWLAYDIALPVSMRFFTGIQSEVLYAVLGADEYLSFAIRLLVGFGIIFELPIVILILSVLGLVTPAFLRKKRRHAIVASTIVASLLSPGDVIMVTVLMMAPLILLYELGIFLSWLVTRGRDEEEQSILPDPEPPAGSVEAR
jgi:sec-independent protein translocase protein TatC